MSELAESINPNGNLDVMKRIRNELNNISKAHFGELDNTECLY